MRKVILFAIVGLLAAQTTQVKNERPGGAPDGVRQFFTLKSTPVKWSTQVYRNGLRQFIGIDYGEYPATKRIGFFPCCLPQAGDLLLADYEYAP